MSTPIVPRPGGRSRPGRIVALLTVTAVAASLLSVPAGQTPANADPAPATTPGAAESLPADAEPVAVTVITGDTVYWQNTGDGNPRVEVQPAPRDNPVEFDQSGTREDFYVIPTDAMEHVVDGTLDRELFNIPGLIRQGLDDATTDELPVIVTFDQDRSTQQLTRAADALPATSNATTVDKVNGTGVTVDRGRASTFREAVFGSPGRDGSARTSGAQRLDGAVEKIMLDRALEIDLAESVPQIGAPQAWDAGYTGKGVTVAVLDTGIDTSHPDLAGQVVASANFTNEPDATDTHGHGTHVASTIAGTGTASDGARTGVAPGTDLLNGKVCVPTPDGQGLCKTSWIMAGMEWATAQGADIVNMSLGGDPTNGTDPLSQLLNTLSSETGTLFVTSAGNTGCCQRVGTPGAADAALAVGAVDNSDRLASWSSRGPRLGDHAVKPEITAPGVGIVAARAEGTSPGRPVDDQYTSISGTSMASPHVAGAAALLAQARPDLGWEDLKDALVSTTTDLGYLWYEQGVGRVDVPAVLERPVHATGTVNLGQVTDQAEQDVTYTNHSNEDITLDLEVAVTDGSGQAIDAASLSPDTLTVPAAGKATATVAVDLTGVPEREDLFGGGVVTATGDGVSLRTGVGFGPVRHTLTIEVLDSNGDPIGTPAVGDTEVHVDHDTYDPSAPVGSPSYVFSTSEGVASGHLPTGIYTLKAVVREDDLDTGEQLRGSVLVAVDVVVDADMTVTLDARDAVPVQVSVPRDVDQRNHQVTLFRQRPSIDPGHVETLRTDGHDRPMYVTPAEPSRFGFLALLVTWVLAEPQAVHPLPDPNGKACTRAVNPLPFWCYSEAPAYVYNLPFLYDNGIPGNLHEKVTRRDLVEVPTRFHSDRPDDVYILHQFEAHPPFSAFLVVQDYRIWIKPGEVTEYFPADDRFTWVRRVSSNYWPEVEPLATGVSAQISSDWFPTAGAGTKRAEESWGQAPLRVGTADVREEFFHAPRGFSRPATASRGGVNGNQFIPGYEMMDNTRGHLFSPGGTLPAFASWRMWNLDTSVELEGVEFNPRHSVPAFTLASTEATYRLEQTDEYPEEARELFRTGPTTTTWTFNSHPSDAQVPAGYTCPHPLVGQPQRACQIQPLIQLEYDLRLDTHNSVSARRGAHMFTITAGHHSKAIDRAPITSMAVEASFDDGGTWQDARVVGKPKNTWDTGGLLHSSAPYQEFRVVLRIPPLQRTSGFVTLRVRATDANGGTIEQTVHRAYILR